MLDGLFPNYRAPALRDVVDRLAWTDETERGAVYTKPEIVRAILDLAGYTPDLPLHKRRLLEPSFGGGDLLFSVLDRLLCAYLSQSTNLNAFGTPGFPDLAPVEIVLVRQVADEAPVAKKSRVLVKDCYWTAQVALEGRTLQQIAEAPTAHLGGLL